jgi:hypothetical protein
MRPNKPGHYWWEDHKECLHVAEFDDDLETYDCLEFVKPEKFEESPYFKRWLGQAHPPKKVQRYELTYSGLECSDEYDGVNDGDWVEYKDVKEYLLEDEE